MNENLIAQLIKYGEDIQNAVKAGIENASKEILGRSTKGMRRFENDIAISKKTGKRYYKTKNKTRTLRALSGALVESLVIASAGKNFNGGIFNITSDKDVLIEFGTEVKSERGYSYPVKHDAMESRFRFLTKLVKPKLYMKAILKEAKKIRV